MNPSVLAADTVASNAALTATIIGVGVTLLVAVFAAWWNIRTEMRTGLLDMRNEIRTELLALRSELHSLGIELHNLGERVARIEGRLDERDHAQAK